MFWMDCFVFLVCSFSPFKKKAWINKTDKLTASVIPLIQMPKWSWNKPMWNWAYLGVNLISLGIVDWINWYRFNILTIHYLPLTKCVSVLWEQDHPGLAGRCRFGLVLLMSGKEPGLFYKISFSLVHHVALCPDKHCLWRDLQKEASCCFVNSIPHNIHSSLWLSWAISD